MIGLLRAELRRFTARRLMRVAAISLLALLLLGLVRVGFASDPDATGGVRQVPIEEQRERADLARQSCERQKANGQIPPDFECDFQVNEGTAFESEPDRRLRAKDALKGTVLAVAIFVGLLSFVAAASFVGADWQSGTLQALLFWEPRRGRVLFAKAVAVVLVSVAFLFVIEAVAYGGVLLVAATRGTTEGVTGGLHVSNLLLVLRAGVFVSVVALLGYVVAGLSRFTAAALGGAFVYFAFVENALLTLRPAWERWMISRNVSAILANGIQVQPARRPPAGDDFGGGFGFEELTRYTLTSTRGAVTLAVYLAILLGAYYLSFTRRDVT